MLLFSLSLSLQSLINHHQILIIISSFCLITKRNLLIDYKTRYIQFIIILIDRVDLIYMLHTKLVSSSSSNSTFAFETSSIQTNDSQEKIPSIICLNETNFNRNANDIDEENRFLHRFIQSSTDITTKDFSSSINRENSHHKNNAAIRIESALMTSDYSHSRVDISRPIIDINMNRTIDLIKRNGAGDENLSSPIYDKQMQTPAVTGNNQYLTLEQVPVHNRRTSQLTSKQLILISISVFLFVILLSSITIFFIF